MNRTTETPSSPVQAGRLAASEFTAPARVNLIGEHTDYTGGFVLPIAIPFSTSARIAPGTGDYQFRSESFGSVRSMAPGDLSPAVKDWSDYPVGVLRQLQARGIAPPSFDLTIRGDIPLGAGLSSSASIEVVTAVALLAFSGQTMDVREIARLCQQAENEYVNSPCGIMDQFAVAGAEAKHALMLNTRDLSFELLPMDQGEIAECCIVVANSMVKHSIAGGDYGLRRREVEAGQTILCNAIKQLRDLGDASLEQLDEHEAEMSLESYKRCRHIITENGRVLEAREAMDAGDAARLGDAMTRSHLSQRDNFECSVPEIDFLVEAALMLPGCLGARLTGGGFGGCTVNLVRSQEAEAFSNSLKNSYKNRFGIDAEVYICEAVDGALARLANS